jgi:threonine-phosphate decarboxylase
LEPLRERGILLRDCGNYRGLEAGWYRTAVRTQEENRRLIQSLEEILKEGTP